MSKKDEEAIWKNRSTPTDDMSAGDRKTFERVTHTKWNPKDKVYNPRSTTMIAYLKIQDGVTGLTDWHGNVLTTEVRIISARKLTGCMSDKLLYLRFKYDSKIWSGTSMGNGMVVRAKLTKLKKL